MISPTKIPPIKKIRNKIKSFEGILLFLCYRCFFFFVPFYLKVEYYTKLDKYQYADKHNERHIIHFILCLQNKDDDTHYKNTYKASNDS